MNKGLQWIIGISAVVIALAVAASLVGPLFFPQAGWQGMMGPNHMYGGTPMMGGFGTMGLFGLGMWLVPLLFIGLVVFGAVWLVKSVATPAAGQLLAAGPHCANCGQPLQANWKACPHCGEKVG